MIKEINLLFAAADDDEEARSKAEEVEIEVEGEEYIISWKTVKKSEMFFLGIEKKTIPCMKKNFF